MNSYYVYILRCSDGSLYTGITKDIKKRIAEHNSKSGAKYTRSRLPVRLLYFEEGYEKSDALKREIAIKKLTKKKKEELVINFDKKKLAQMLA